MDETEAIKLKGMVLQCELMEDIRYEIRRLIMAKNEFDVPKKRHDPRIKMFKRDVERLLEDEI